MAISKLKPEDLTSEQLIPSDFSNTGELEPLIGLIDQGKAVKSMDFSLNLKKKGYNLYVSGNWGSGRTSYVLEIAEKTAKKKPVSTDWIYVSNFKKTDEPIAIELSAGTADDFKKNVKDFIDIIRTDFNKELESNELERSRQEIVNFYKKKSQDIVNEMNSVIKPYDFVFIKTENGLMSVPAKDGKPMSEEQYKEIDNEEEYERLRQNSEKIGLISVDYFRRLRESDLELDKKIEELKVSTAKKVINYAIDSIFKDFNYGEEAKKHLDIMIEDIIENIDMFIEEKLNRNNQSYYQENDEDFFDRYAVNDFICRENETHAPIVFESNPTFSKLIGSIEYVNKSGMMITDLTHIKAGALHKANGGYLILHAKDLLMNPYSWEALKRALLSEKISIEPMTATDHISTLSLRPRPIPLDIKVVIIGDEYYYQVLYNYDESFRKLFKVKAAFDSEMEASNENAVKLYRYISKFTIENNLKPFDSSAVKRVSEYTKRLAEDKQKFSTHLSMINDILIQSDAWASIDNKDFVSGEDVIKALEEKNDRVSSYKEKILEMFKDGTYLIDVTGKKIGEINGLAVISIGDYSFGKPSKISASTFVGTEGVVSIERESESSGRIHDKGLMTIYGYLGDKYAQDKPLSLTAVIAFEQLYSGIDGDSASSTELYALISSLSKTPINQALAVTGSVNQRGEIQPIGGVNEKIEGFFSVCRIKGVNFEQGVIIPRQNIRNLMLSDEVIEAVRKNEFNVYAIDTIDDGIELLTGKKAEEIHILVDNRLKELKELGAKPHAV